MSFFEQVPPVPEQQLPKGPYGPDWAPPAWDRPSEAILPGGVQLDLVLGRGERAALVLRGLEVYPNGVVLDVEILLNPRVEHDMRGMMLWHGGGDMPRLGVEYADGRRAGASAPVFGTIFGAVRDDAGLPTEPILMPRGGGGGGAQFSFSQWLYPLPEGPLKIYATWPTIGLDETMVEIAGDEIEAAATRATVLWE
jgi:hypothetical protein